MKALIPILLLLLVTTSCLSPTEYLEIQEYDKAIRKATRQLINGKRIAENASVITEAYKQKIEWEIQKAETIRHEGEVKDWIKLRKHQYRVLEDIGESNKLLKGRLTGSFDRLCRYKEGLDYQIVRHFQGKGDSLYAAHVKTGNKYLSRRAYYNFRDSQENGGDAFFPDLDQDLEDAHKGGIVYYRSTIPISSSNIFLKPLPRDADFRADCSIRGNRGYVRIHRHEQKDRDRVSREIKVRERSERDTSGNIRYIPVYEEVSATVITTTITISAEITAHRYVSDLTGQCPLRSEWKDFDDSEQYEKVEWSGDRRAFAHGPPGSGDNCCKESSIERELRDDLRRCAEDWLRDLGGFR